MGRFIDEGTGKWAPTEGSDGRGNTSSRSSSRMFYLSRDKGSVYSWRVRKTTTGNDKYVWYLFNDTVTSERFFLEKVRMKSDTTCDVNLHLVTGTAAGGTVSSGVVWCSGANHDIDGSIRVGSDITGLTDVGVFEDFDLEPNIPEVEDIGGAIIIDPGDAIAIQVSVPATVKMTVIGAFE